MTSRGEYHLDVRRIGRGDKLSIALRDPRGDVVHHQHQCGDEARSVYEALMTALDVALRHECTHLQVSFSPSELIDLVREIPRGQAELSPVESALRRWTLYQLRLFASVTFTGSADLRYGPISAESSRSIGRRFGRA